MGGSHGRLQGGEVKVSRGCCCSLASKAPCCVLVALGGHSRRSVTCWYFPPEGASCGRGNGGWHGAGAGEGRRAEEGKGDSRSPAGRGQLWGKAHGKQVVVFSPSPQNSTFSGSCILPGSAPGRCASPETGAFMGSRGGGEEGAQVLTLCSLPPTRWPGAPGLGSS